MESNLNRNQLNVLRQKIKQANEAKWLEACKQRLTSIISRKFTTTFIGSLDIFEKYFGFLWKSEDGVLTPEQQSMKQLYEQVRTEILNHGNNQRRAAENEIGNHIVHWNRYHMDLNIKKEQL